MIYLITPDDASLLASFALLQAYSGRSGPIWVIPAVTHYHPLQQLFHYDRPLTVLYVYSAASDV